MLKISPLVLGYDGKRVAAFPGLMLDSGKTCLLHGDSGSGKTSLLYAIAGLHPPLDGHIEVDGIDIASLRETARDRWRGKNLGIIFQTLHLVRSLGVIDNLRLAASLSGKTIEAGRPEALLDRLGILAKKDDLPEQLSQGQQQRVAIARAVMHRPSLILADEPTSSLDDRSAKSVAELILSVAAESGASLVVSTHDARLKPYFTNVVTLGAAL